MAKKRGYYDGDMIKGMSGGFANMPAKEIVKMYPINGYSGTNTINDGIKGIDTQIYDDGKNKKKKEMPEKF